MSTCRMPNTRTGRLNRSPYLPRMMLPSASPAMKAASTVLTAYVVLPNTVTNMRVQATSYISPVMPDTKKSAKITNFFPSGLSIDYPC